MRRWSLEIWVACGEEKLVPKDPTIKLEKARGRKGIMEKKWKENNN